MYLKAPGQPLAEGLLCAYSAAAATGAGSAPSGPRRMPAIAGAAAQPSHPGSPPGCPAGCRADGCGARPPSRPPSPGPTYADFWFCLLAVGFVLVQVAVLVYVIVALWGE